MTQRSDVPANIEFRENIDNAIKNWEEMRHAPRQSQFLHNRIRFSELTTRYIAAIQHIARLHYLYFDTMRPHGVTLKRQ